MAYVFLIVMVLAYWSVLSIMLRLLAVNPEEAVISWHASDVDGA